MFNLFSNSTRRYDGDVPEPRALTVRVTVDFERKISDYHSETLSTSKLDVTLPVNSDGKICDIRAAIEQQLGHVLAPIDSVLESDPRLTDGAWKKSQVKEE